jgi:PAS domain S-box-containing protein
MMFFPYLIPYLISLALSTGVGLYAWRHRDVNGAASFALYALAQASMTLGYIFELPSASLEAKIFWDNTQFVGMLVAPMATLAFALQYTGRKLSHPKRVWGTLTIVSLISLLLVFTDDWHGLIRSEAWLVPGEPFSALAYDFSPSFWAIAMYAYGVILSGLFILASEFIHPQRLYRDQVGTILIGVLVPLVGMALTLLDITLTFQRDTTPFTFAIGNLVIAWGLFRYRLFNVVPVARDQVIESMNDIVVVLDAQGRVVDLNPAAQEMIGRTASGLIGQPATQVFSNWPNLVEQFQEEEKTRTEIAIGVGESRRHFGLNLSPLSDQHGHLAGRMFVMRDITERVRAKQMLQKAHDELERRVQERTIELAQTNADLKAEIAEWMRAEEALRLYADRLKTLHEIDQGILAARSPEAIAQVTIGRIQQLISCQGAYVTLFDFTTDEAVVLATDLDTESQLKVGARLPLESFAETLHAQDAHAVIGVPLVFKGKLIGSLNLMPTDLGAFTPEYEEVAREIADQLAIAIQQARLNEQIQRHAEELNQAYQTLEKFDKTKSDFIEVTAHELRTPLTLIKGYAHLLEALPAIESDAEARLLLGGALDGLTRMHDIVVNMLDMARIDTQILPLNLDTIALSGIIRSIQHDLEQALRERRLTLTVKGELGDLPAIQVDYELLHKVFYHLIVNAIKYTPDGGSIQVSGRVISPDEGKPEVEIVVSDSGIGIDSAHHELIFEKFYQTGPTSSHSSGKTKFKGGGPGLGLAIVRGIVLAHDGKVWVESEGHDEERCPGSRFHVRLPIQSQYPSSMLSNIDPNVIARFSGNPSAAGAGA